VPHTAHRMFAKHGEREASRAPNRFRQAGLGVFGAGVLAAGVNLTLSAGENLTVGIALVAVCA